MNLALAELAAARKLDPKLFEAHMNYAHVNLGFRGFEQAREAFARALALRGPMTGMEADVDPRIAAVQAELDAAKKIDPKRPDAYVNEAILTHEFRARTGNEEQMKTSLRRASKTFATFLSMAEGKGRYETAAKSARGRIEDIEATLDFLSTR